MKIHSTNSTRNVNAQGRSPELPKGVVLEDDLEFDEDIEIGPDAEFGPPLHFTVPEDPGDD